eukprot:Colp12_sorted_trinity150504_noHs@28070
MVTMVENLKMAREYALLGSYSEALVYYESILQQIQQCIHQFPEQDAKHRWENLRAEVNEECKLVSDIVKELSQFKVNQIRKYSFDDDEGHEEQADPDVWAPPPNK